MYRASVSSRMTIDKDGTRLDNLDVDVDGWRDPGALEQERVSYNRGDETPYRLRDRCPSLWYYLLYGMSSRLRRWRYRRLQ
jgi:hypothetical protein